MRSHPLTCWVKVGHVRRTSPHADHLTIIGILEPCFREIRKNAEIPWSSICGAAKAVQVPRNAKNDQTHLCARGTSKLRQGNIRSGSSGFEFTGRALCAILGTLEGA